MYTTYSILRILTFRHDIFEQYTTDSIFIIFFFFFTSVRLFDTFNCSKKLCNKEIYSFLCTYNVHRWYGDNRKYLYFTLQTNAVQYNRLYCTRCILSVRDLNSLKPKKSSSNQRWFECLRLSSEADKIKLPYYEKKILMFTSLNLLLNFVETNVNKH